MEVKIFAWLVFPCNFSDTKFSSQPLLLSPDKQLYSLLPARIQFHFSPNVFWQFSRFRQHSCSIKFCSYSFIPNAITTMTVELNSLSSSGKVQRVFGSGSILSSFSGTNMTWMKYSNFLFAGQAMVYDYFKGKETKNFYSIICGSRRASKGGCRKDGNK